MLDTKTMGVSMMISKNGICNAKNLNHNHIVSATTKKHNIFER